MSKKLIIIWLTFIIVLVGCFLFMGLKVDKRYKKYYKIESSLEEAASVYMSTNGFNLTNGDSMKVDINDLVPAFIDSIEVEDDTCNGYVLISKDKNKVVYKTYLTCNNYKTLKD